MSIHKERVRAFFARSHADRVPINYSSNPGIDRRLKQRLGLADNDKEGLLKALDVDFRSVWTWSHYRGPPLHTPIDGRKIDLWGAHTRWIEHGSGG